ncbi:tyrosine-type recombinase/integrase [Xanthobacter aminoxidans]|uniref:Tyrosine-type recombinase/integrase n=1 Tax=Xanthobacter aminoxidans TaxID=186280 RepID=A0ABW6ZD29_9HYPH
MAQAVRLTKRVIDQLPEVDRDRVFFDSDLKGFGVRVTPTGLKTFVLEYRPGGGGRGVSKRRIKLGTYGELTPDQARTMARDALADVRRGGDPAGERAAKRAAPTVDEMAERFLEEEAKPKKKPRTADGYAELLRNHILPALGTRKAEQVSEPDVALMHRRIGAKAPVAANRAVAALSAVFTWAQRERIVPKGHNPCQGINKFREERREAFLSTEQLSRLGDAIREAETVGIPWDPDPTKKSKHAPKVENRRTQIDPYAAAALRLLLLTGGRLREILHLRWDHVDLERGLLFLPDSKTGKKTIVLNGPAMALLTELPRAGAFVIAGASAGTAGEKPRADLQRPWALVSRRAGFFEMTPVLTANGEPDLDAKGKPKLTERPTVRLHDLRHTHASIGAGAGLGLPVIGKLLGHTQASTTQRYAHLDADPLRRASDQIGRAIAAAMGEPASKISNRDGGA